MTSDMRQRAGNRCELDLYEISDLICLFEEIMTHPEHLTA